MQDEMEIICCALDKGVNLTRFDNQDIANIEGDRLAFHNGPTATPGDEVNLVQLAMKVPLVNALVGKTNSRQRWVRELSIPPFGWSGLVASDDHHRL